jgi:hypothetical protein
MAAAFTGEVDLLLLLDLGLRNERLPVVDESASACSYKSPASAGDVELGALDVAFAGVGQGGSSEWSVGG